VQPDDDFAVAACLCDRIDGRIAAAAASRSCFRGRYRKEDGDSRLGAALAWLGTRALVWLASRPFCDAQAPVFFGLELLIQNRNRPSQGPRLTSRPGDLNLNPVPPPASSSALERVNLNLPPVARDKLRSLAKAAGQPEGVYARELLLSALARADAAEFRRRLEASRSPARRERDRQIATAIERLRG